MCVYGSHVCLVSSRQKEALHSPKLEMWVLLLVLGVKPRLSGSLASLFLTEPSSSLNPFALASECWVLGMYHADHFICVWCFCGFEPRALHMQTSSHLTYTLGRILVSLSFLFFAETETNLASSSPCFCFPVLGLKECVTLLPWCFVWAETLRLYLCLRGVCLFVFYFLIPGQWTKSRETVF